MCLALGYCIFWGYFPLSVSCVLFVIISRRSDLSTITVTRADSGASFRIQTIGLGVAAYLHSVNPWKDVLDPDSQPRPAHPLGTFPAQDNIHSRPNHATNSSFSNQTSNSEFGPRAPSQPATPGPPIHTAQPGAFQENPGVYRDYFYKSTVRRPLFLYDGAQSAR